MIAFKPRVFHSYSVTGLYGIVVARGQYEFVRSI